MEMEKICKIISIWLGIIIIYYLLVYKYNKRNKTWHILKIENAFTIGIMIFYVIPLLWIDEIALNYELIIILGYLIFIILLNITRKYCKKLSNIKLFTFYPKLMHIRIALYYCILFIIIYYILNVAPSLKGIINLISHKSASEYGLIRTQELYYTMGSDTATMKGLLNRISEAFFISFWGILFLKKVKISVLLWTIYAIEKITSNYYGRFGMIALIGVPFFCYIKIKSKKKIILIIIFLIVVLIFAPFYGIWRLGDLKEMLDIKSYLFNWMISISTPIENATLLINRGIRSNWKELVENLLLKPIPVLIWPGKPIRNFNYDVTYLIYKRYIGQDMPISTFTLFGEGWYYFGNEIGIIIMFSLYAISCALYELFLLNKNPLFIVYYIWLIMNSGFYLFDNYSDLYGFIIRSWIYNVIITIAIKKI